MALIEKTILDRNGNPKVITVAVKDDFALPARESWRGIEFGWSADDVAPDDGGASALRQEVCDRATATGGTVLARQYSVDNEDIEVVYHCGNRYVVYGEASIAAIKKWAKEAKISFKKAHWARMTHTDKGFRFDPLS